MSRFSEKQLLIATIVVFVLVVGGFGALIYADLERIYAAEITDENPEAADITDEALWGERRQIQELEKRHAVAAASADKIPERERNVIVYREIVRRDTQMLPSATEVHDLANAINDYERMAGVQLKKVSDLNVGKSKQAISPIPIKLALTGTYDQVLKFINLFENYDRLVNTANFSITAGKAKGKGPEATAVHNVTVDLITYMYASKVGLSKQVDIANYELRTNEPEIQKLIRQQKAPHVETYTLKNRINRRDPLVDPRRSEDDVPDEADIADLDEQKNIVAKLRFSVEDLKENVRQLLIYHREQKYVQYAQLKSIVEQKIAELELDIRRDEPRITFPELKDILNEDVLEPFAELKDQLDVQDDVPATLSRRQVEEFLNTVVTALESGDWKKAVDQHETYLNLSKQHAVSPDAAELVDRMTHLRKQAEAQIEFAALQLKYTGLILQKQGSRVIVNGKACKEGQYVDPANRCKLITIEKDRLIYELDGFEIEDHPKSR